MSDDSWARRTRAGIGWSVATFATGRVLTFVATLILARLLVPAEFGVVAAILVYTSLLELASDLGMQATVVYEQERGRSERVDSAFTINLGIAVTLSALGVILAPFVADFFGAGGDVGLFRLAALSLVITGLGNVHDGLLLRELDFRRRVIPELTKGTVRGVVSIALAVAGAGAASLVFGMLAGQAAWVAALWAITAYRPRLTFDRAIASSMAAYGSGAVALEILGVVATRADTIVVGKVLGVAALGIYTVAFRVPEVLIRSVTWSVSNVTFPALSQVRAQERHTIPAATLTLLRYQALGSLPVAATLAVLSGPLIVFLFGEKWEAGGGVMAAIAVATGIGSLAYPLGDTFKALGRQRTMVAVNLINLPLLVGAMILVAPNGIVWVAWSVTALTLANFLIVAVLVSRLLGLGAGEYAGAIWPALASAGGCGLAAGIVSLAGSSQPLVFVVSAGLCAAALGGTLALRFLAPDVFRTVAGLVHGMRERRAARRRSEAAASPSGEEAIVSQPPRHPRFGLLRGWHVWGIAVAVVIPALAIAGGGSSGDHDRASAPPSTVAASRPSALRAVGLPARHEVAAPRQRDREPAKTRKPKPENPIHSHSGGAVPPAPVTGSGGLKSGYGSESTPSPDSSPVTTQAAVTGTSPPSTQTTGKPADSPDGGPGNGNGPTTAPGPDGNGPPGQLP